MRKALPALSLLLAGCTLLFTTASVHEVPLQTSLPPAMADSLKHINAVATVRFIPLEEAEAMTVKAPSGHFYEYNFNAALDSLCAELTQRKLTVTENAADTIYIEVTAAQQQVEAINPNVGDFRYSAGFIVELRIHSPAGIQSKAIVYHDEVTVQQSTVAATTIKDILDGLLLSFARNIAATLDERYTD